MYAQPTPTPPATHETTTHAASGMPVGGTHNTTAHKAMQTVATTSAQASIRVDMMSATPHPERVLWRTPQNSASRKADCAR